MVSLVRMLYAADLSSQWRVGGGYTILIVVSFGIFPRDIRDAFLKSLLPQSRAIPFTFKWTTPTREKERQTASHNPTTASRHLPPNSARIDYGHRRALCISSQLSTGAACAFLKVWVLLKDCGSNIASKHVRKHEARPSRIKTKKWFRLDSGEFGFICAGVSKAGGYIFYFF